MTITSLPAPPLRRTPGTRVLPCGCAAAVYETLSGEFVDIIDSRGRTCPYLTHATDVVISRTSAQLPTQP